MLTSRVHSRYLIEFIDAYLEHPDDKYEREAACLAVQCRFALAPIQPGDLLAGRLHPVAAGFFPQLVGKTGMGYFLDEELYAKLSASLPDSVCRQLGDRVALYRGETSLLQLYHGHGKEIKKVLPSDRFDKQSGAAFFLCRMSGAQLDFKKLLRLGIGGLCAALRKKERQSSGEAQSMYKAMYGVLQTLSKACLSYAAQAHEMGDFRLGAALDAVSKRAPQNFLEAAQLMFLYALVSGVYNYGRMDDALGDFLAKDLNEGVLTTEEALEIIKSLWRLISARGTTWDGRVIIGGRGRENEKNANLFARLAMQASREQRDTLPQLSLRFYQGQEEELFQYALKCIGEGGVYPMLYNDDVNIPAVQAALSVPECEAEDYVPFGCGEYIINHRSFGTPSGVINLLKVLELTLFGGFDHVSGHPMGLSSGGLMHFETFEELFAAYQRQAEYYIDALAAQEAAEYRIAAHQAGYLYLSLLYDDCVERGKPIFDGGVRYLGGTLETYGNTNTADALTAIRELVYEKKAIGKQKLLSMLLYDFAGCEREKKLLKDAPKYGNDIDAADKMLSAVHEHVCRHTLGQAQKNGLHSYLAVVINNSANTAMGEFTLASADGRGAGCPMANGNNPSPGSDKNGVTAFLNSLTKPRTDIHAGAVQNMKFSSEWFQKFPQKTQALLKGYFSAGGAQAMLTVLSRGDLEQALLHPEDYQNLIVRVGGFCARFVTLDAKVQREILSRTMY